jgi:hypothetical protein
MSEAPLHESVSPLSGLLGAGLGAAITAAVQWGLKRLPSRTDDAAACRDEAEAEQLQADAHKTGVEALALVIENLRGQVDRLTSEVMQLRGENASLGARVNILTEKIREHGITVPPESPLKG